MEDQRREAGRGLEGRWEREVGEGERGRDGRCRYRRRGGEGRACGRMDVWKGRGGEGGEGEGRLDDLGGRR